uniref:Protein transport protein Sec31A n=1 Tax=Pygocentrus nattereri TaxID=42514 RepID=A0AAR2L418_PYGNA
MRVKEILRTATQAWSPAAHHPAYLALGTSAQQLDASFNTTAALEIFEMDFADTSMDMKLRGSLSTTNRFHSLIWVTFDMGVDGSSGRLIGGGENGTLTVYSPDAILSSADDAVIGQSSKHTGPVRALDYNPFQSNLLASGANDSEIYIWDLNNLSNPMTPGTKSQPVEDVCVVAWNKQVQHILASAGPSGRAVVWDLRKNEPIIKISDHSNRMHCSGMLWHPEVATQMILASEDDRQPVIQMWDLRFATSPLKVLENHTRGILSVSWSQADPELLLSSAKDNRILCWNPNTGEVIYELPTVNQWCFDVQWCPRNPALLSAASFDGHISVYTVMGGCLEAQQYSSVDKISGAFDPSDPFGTGQALPPLQVPQPTAAPTIIPPLRTPPKWERRPIGASFTFGGKLVTFDSPRSVQPAPSPQPPRQVHVSQVITEAEFLQRSRELQATLQSGSFISYCHNKISSAPSEAEQDIWRFLLVNFEDEARVKFLRLLGFSKDELEKKVQNSALYAFVLLSGFSAPQCGVSPEVKPSRSFLLNSSLFFSVDTDGLISQALLVGNFEGAVDLCLSDGRYAEAILLSISGGEELLKKTQQRYLNKQTNRVSMLISSVVTQNWTDIVQDCELDNWKEALAALLTYANPEEFAPLCDTLGSRLEAGGTEKRCLQACLCYICSGNIHKLVECWSSQRDCTAPLMCVCVCVCVCVCSLKSIERLRNSEVTVQSSVLEEKLIHYANILANQGSLETALSYLPQTSQQVHTHIYTRTHTQIAISTYWPLYQKPLPYSSTVYPVVFPPSSLSGPVPPLSSAPGGIVPGSLPGSVPMMPTPPAPGFLPAASLPPLPPSSLPGGPMPMYSGPSGPQGAAPPPLGTAPPPTGTVYPPPGVGYPQGGPGAPGAKTYSQSVPPPPTGNLLTSSGLCLCNRLMCILVKLYLDCLRVEVLQQLPAERVEQKEIPAEHMILKSTFDSLVQRCQLAATDPQTKRKLDDASKRIGSLYDKLRDQLLSPSILSGLHEISRCVSARNYQRALELHTQVVSSSNFSEISAFMPVLKVLMTIGNKLGV